MDLAPVSTGTLERQSHGRRHSSETSPAQLVTRMLQGRRVPSTAVRQPLIPGVLVNLDFRVSLEVLEERLGWKSQD